MILHASAEGSGVDVTILRSVLDYDAGSGVFTWKVRPSRRVYAGDVAGTRDKEGYTVIKFQRRLYFAHRLAWMYCFGHWPTQRIDHINQVKSDNRIENLRDVSHAANMCNISEICMTKTGVRGVTKPKNRYCATINFGGVQRRIGWYDTCAEAKSAYQVAKLQRDAAIGLGV